LVVCSKCAAVALAGVVVFASLVPQQDGHRCVVCASPVSQEFDRDDSPHGRFSTDFVGVRGIVAPASSGDVTVALTGVSATGVAGSVAPSTTVALTGVSASMS
jgi:hypothetical protein